MILLLGVAPSGGAQEPPAPAPAGQPPAASEGSSAGRAPGAGLAGSWAGWARLTNDWPGHPCRYESGAESTAVHLELSAEAGVLKGSTAIDLPAGEGCPPLRKRYMIAEVVVSEATVSFSDSGGNEWNLSIRRGGGVLQGLLAWRQGGAEEPLAEGFALPDGTKPGARLSGEVRLHKETSGETDGGAGASPGESSAATTEKKATGVGHTAKIIGIILGANAVGIGLLYGVNQLGKGTSSSGVVTCSPHNCIVGDPGQPCFCEGNVLSGASCGSTTAGVPVGGACKLPSQPCQAGFSCNSGLCEDRFGRCPY
jgi:hypothetical protein